jgi:spermidine synthase
MKWFFEIRTRKSGKNGLITAKRFFGTWTVYVNGCEQTGPYAHAMWANAFKKLRNESHKKIKKILVLGLGASGEIKILHKHFPNCKVTAIEYDPEMVFLTKELKLYAPFPIPDIKLGDAAEIVPQLKDQFDLVIVDLFHEFDPSPLVTDNSFLTSLERIVATDGIILVNVFRKKEYLNTVENFFDCMQSWQFGSNNLALFCRKSYAR